MTLKFSVPDRATPFTEADGKTVSMEWYMAISAIVQQLGGPAVVPGGSVINDALIIEAVDDARNAGDQVPLLFSNVKDNELLEALGMADIESSQIPSLVNSTRGASVDVALILHDGIDAINKAQMALKAAIVEQSTMIDVIRSMASQDSSHVDIRGGLIDGTIIGSRTPAAATVTTLNKLIFTQPATSATYTLVDGKTFSVSNTLTLTATDGATLAIGGGGTLGTAAYTAASTYALLAGSSGQNFAANNLTTAGILTTIGGATLHTTSSALTDGAGVALGTLATAPSAGNPTKWIGINDNGTTRYIPSW